MTDQSAAAYQQEVKAIGDMLASLEPLTGPARERVLAYVANALNIGLPSLSLSSPPVQHQPIPSQPSEISPPPAQSSAAPIRRQDIRSLRDTKQPRSALEMAAIVAYYLSELAPDTERRETVSTADLDKYFKQAGFRLPKKQNMTLVNAASAGYFDRVNQGQYRLNPVGYNLVAHNLPSGSTDGESRTRATRRASPAKKSPAAKKTVARRKAVGPKKATKAAKTGSR